MFLAPAIAAAPVRFTALHVNWRVRQLPLPTMPYSVSKRSDFLGTAPYLSQPSAAVKAIFCFFMQQRLSDRHSRMGY
jgi:hypothetical protein